LTRFYKQHGQILIGSLLTVELFNAATPRISAGDLTVMRSTMVGNAHFEAISNRIGLTQPMEIGSGMARGEVKGKMIADMFEAVFGALFSEGGADAVMKFWRACKA